MGPEAQDAQTLAALSRGSIARRLLIAAAGWSLAVLIVAGLSLDALYRSETEQRIEESISATILTLATAVDSNEAGEIVYTDTALPNDERYGRTYSGMYWAFLVTGPENRVLRADRSRSFYDVEPVVPQAMVDAAIARPGEVQFADARGPDSALLHYGVRAVRLPDRLNPVVLYAGIDRTSADAAVRRFGLRLAVALAVLAIGLVGGVLFLIRYGLMPLRNIRHNLADVRSGRRERLEGEYPEELAPLVGEINTLISHNREVVERARTQVGNLAHALKTPLAVLRNEAQSGDDKLSEVVRRQTEAMKSNVEHYLKRAQAAAQAEVLGARADVGEAADGIARMLERLHRDKDIAIFVDAAEDAVFRGERGDLDELIGNLLENAAKWCKARINVTARRIGDTVEIVVDDDGNGLRAEDREAALERGRRLDETAPGTGLGLSIVTDLTEIYGGDFQLEDSPLGGLRARLVLPAAAT